MCELEETSTTTTITLQWKPRTKISKGVTAYRVEYSENKPSSLKKSVDISIEETSFTVTELLPGTEYQVNVRTVTANGTGTPAEIIATTSKLLATRYIYLPARMHNNNSVHIIIVKIMIVELDHAEEINCCM